VKPYYEEAGIKIYHGDCREILPQLGRFDLLLTDPPYGIGVGRTSHATSGLVVGHGNRRVAKRSYPLESWDDAAPNLDIPRNVAVSQIIFGGNYFPLPPSKCWLVWDKQVNGNFADCELAWTNLDKPVRKISWLWNGFAREGGEDRYDHPTQKPLGVMKWCISQVPNEVCSLVDPYMGSGTSLVAAKDLGILATGIELEERYCEIAANRLRQSVLNFEAVAG
jgi:DNA modification methylase